MFYKIQLLDFDQLQKAKSRSKVGFRGNLISDCKSSWEMRNKTTKKIGLYNHRAHIEMTEEIISLQGRLSKGTTGLMG